MDSSLELVCMGRRSAEELRNELSRLMQEQVESLRKASFGGFSEEELRQHEMRLKLIREVSADFILALKRNAQ